MRIKFFGATSLLVAICTLTLTLTNCAGPQAPFVDSVWTLVEYKGEPFTATDNYRVTFSAQGRASGVADCNSFMGNYTQDEKEGTIKVKNKALTRAKCKNRSMEQEFIKMLEAAKSYEISGVKLKWIDASGEVLGVFETTPPVEKAEPETK